MSFKQNRDIGILTEKVQQLCDDQKQIYKQIMYICKNEIAHSNNDVYKDDSFEYNYDGFSDFIECLNTTYIVTNNRYVWITGNKITININGSVIKYSPEFQR